MLSQLTYNVPRVRVHIKKKHAQKVIFGWSPPKVILGLVPPKFFFGRGPPKVIFGRGPLKVILE